MILIHWRNDVEGLGALFAKHLPSDSNLMDSHNATSRLADEGGRDWRTRGEPVLMKRPARLRVVGTSRPAEASGRGSSPVEVEGE